MFFTRRRNSVDSRDAVRVKELAGHTEALAEIRRADKQQVDTVDRGDGVDFFDRLQSFNLDRDE